jgi:hypothetical protein
MMMPGGQHLEPKIGLLRNSRRIQIVNGFIPKCGESFQIIESQDHEAKPNSCYQKII